MASVKVNFLKEKVLQNDVIRLISTSSLFKFERSNATIKISLDLFVVKECAVKDILNARKTSKTIIEIDYPFSRNAGYKSIIIEVANISDEDIKHLKIELAPISLQGRVI